MWRNIHIGAVDVLFWIVVSFMPAPFISKDPFILGKSNLSSVLHLPSLDGCPIIGIHEDLQGPLQCLVRGLEEKEQVPILFFKACCTIVSLSPVGPPLQWAFLLQGSLFQKRVTHPCNFKGYVIPHLAQLYDSTSAGLRVLSP